MRHRETHQQLVAARIAELLSSQHGAELCSLLRSTLLLPAGEQTDRAGGPSPGAATAVGEHVGIWERKQQKGETWFVRSMARQGEWFRWANVPRIAPKAARRRIVLVGESVARGWFYDPVFTPAGVLSHLLTSVAGEGAFEVVDLARTSLGLDIVELAAQALTLQPDVMVVFAGNNWVNAAHAMPQWQQLMMASQRNATAAQLHTAFEAHLRPTCERTIGSISSSCKAQNVALLWIVPEYNLLDWRDPATLPGGIGAASAGRWAEACEAAMQALASENFATARELATGLAQKDGPPDGSSLQLLGRCERADRNAARGHLEAARDATAWVPSRQWYPPRTHRIVQSLMREHAGSQRQMLVDVPEVLAAYGGDALPGRNTMLDHCHLNADGIRVTMAAAASQLLELVSGTHSSWRDLLARAPSPNGKTEAEVAFLSAIHNAHWWQQEDVVEHHCRRALQASPHIAPIMKSFLRMQINKTPRLMSGLAGEASMQGTPVIDRYLASNRFIEQRLEVELEQAVLNAMGEGQGRLRQDLHALRREERSVKNATIDLLDYYYRAAVARPAELGWTLRGGGAAGHDRQADYHVATWPSSTFYFVAEERLPLRMEIVSRLPARRDAGTVVLRLNDTVIATLSAGAAWRNEIVMSDGASTRDGLNVLQVIWPAPSVQGGHEEAADLSVVFGHIHALTVSADAHLVRDTTVGAAA